MKNIILFVCGLQFWSDFWPNFWSTISGLVIGIPVALLTNRAIVNSQEKQNQKEQEQRIKNSLIIISRTLLENQRRQQDIVKTLNDNKVLFDTLLDTSAWEVVKDEISRHLHDQELKKRIAYHFSILTNTTTLNTLYLNNVTGLGGAVTGEGIRNFRTTLKNHLIEQATWLSVDSSTILSLIEERLEKM